MADFGKGSKRIIGVAVTPHIGVEMAIIDKKTGLVHKYAQRPLSYNTQKREIDDYAAFKGALIDMCNEVKVDVRSQFYIVLPNILFNFIDLPSNIHGEEIENILIAKVEEAYIFRKAEPMVSYAVARTGAAGENKYLVYSAIQKEVVEKFKDIISDMGGELVGVEGSNTAILRGIEFQKLANDTIKSGDNWNAVVVSGNNYMLFVMAGNSVIDSVEVPLAIKSLSIEEAYQAISSSLSQNLPNFPAKKLIIVSQTDDISAEVLKSQIVFDDEIVTLECNKYAKSTNLMTVSDLATEDIMGMSPSAIGAAACQTTKLTCMLNVLQKVSVSSGGSSDDLINNIVFGAAIVSAVIFCGLCFGLLKAGEYFSLQASTKETELKSVQSELNTLKGGNGTMNIQDIIPKIVANNKAAISYYDSLSTEIPKNVWLTYVYLKDGTNIIVEGLSLSINDIYEYYQGLKNSSPTSTIQLKRLKIITDMIEKTYDPTAQNEVKLYDFEISNTVKGGAAPAAGAPGGDSDTQGGGTPGDINTPPPPPGGAPQLEPVNVSN